MLGKTRRHVAILGALLCSCTAGGDPGGGTDTASGIDGPQCAEVSFAEAPDPSSESLAADDLVAALPTRSIDAETRRSVVEELATQLAAEYVFADVGERMASELRARLDSKGYDQLNDARALAAALTDDVRALAHDKHLIVLFSPRADAEGNDPPPDAPVPNGGIRRIEILEGNIGYLQLDGLPLLEASRGAISAAFAFLAQTDALVIDNRTNTGGDPRTVALYVSYLSEGAPFVVNEFHWRRGGRIEAFPTIDLGQKSYGKDRPVFVLTSSATFSAGEGLAYSLQTQRRAVIAGEVTGGGAHPVQRAVLGHQFFARIPFARSVSPITGGNWEGTGVQPDVAVPAKHALLEAQRAALTELESSRRLAASF